MRCASSSRRCRRETTNDNWSSQKKVLLRIIFNHYMHNQHTPRGEIGFGYTTTPCKLSCFLPFKSWDALHYYDVRWHLCDFGVKCTKKWHSNKLVKHWIREVANNAVREHFFTFYQWRSTFQYMRGDFSPRVSSGTALGGTLLYWSVDVLFVQPDGWMDWFFKVNFVNQPGFEPKITSAAL